MHQTEKGADGNAQLQILPHVVDQLDALEAVVVLSRGIAAIVLEHAADLDFGAVLIRAGDEAGVRADSGGMRVAVCCGRCGIGAWARRHGPFFFWSFFAGGMF